MPKLINTNEMGPFLLKTWRQVRSVPGGSLVFSRVLGLLAPYSGTMGARVLELEAGRAVIELRESRRVRNHLRSIHAVALMNLLELASGLALNCSLPIGMRAILVGFHVEFQKKARGRIVAKSETEPVLVLPEGGERELRAVARDSAGDVVAEATARWRIGT